MSPTARRASLVAASVVVGVALWLCELRWSAVSLGVFTFVSPPLVVAVWCVASTRAEVRAEAAALGRIFVLLAAVAMVSAAMFGMRPAVLPTLGAAALQLAVLAPLLVAARLIGGDLRRRWSNRRWGPIAAAALGQAFPVLIWLPVFLLAHETHRAQSTVDPAEIGVDWPRERVTFRGAGGTRLAGLWFGHEDPRGALLLIHGIGADKAQFLLSVESLHRHGWEIFTYDQRNHGESGGLTSTLGAVEAEDAVRAWAILREKTRGARIPRVVMGVSMGGAAAQLALPQLEDLDGLILDSTFADIAHVAVRHLPLGPLAPPALALARLFAVPLTGHAVLDLVPARNATRAPPALPVLLLHQRADPLVPFGEAEALARAYGSRATLIPLDGPGHAQGLLHDGARYRDAIEGFANALVTRGDVP